MGYKKEELDGHRRGLRGQLAPAEIIGIVLVIISLAILIVVVYPLFSEDNAFEDVCKLSALTRATVPEATQGYIPLKCQTQKICLTDGSENGKCGNYFIGENADKVKLSSDADDAARKIEETFANELYACWDMMGQGKLSLFTKGMSGYFGLGDKKVVSCVICSRIAVEHGKITEVLNSENGGVNVNKYLETTNVPGTQMTYLQAFTDKQVPSFVSAGTKIEVNAEKGDTKLKQGDDKSNEMVVLFSQIITTSYPEMLGRLLSAGAVGVGGTYAIGGLSTLKFLVSPGALAVIIPAAVGITIVSMADTYAGRVTAEGFCGEITSSSGDAYASGCSSVTILPYNVSIINKMCGIQEGAP